MESNLNSVTELLFTLGAPEPRYSTEQWCEPELCRGLAILHVLAPVKGGWLAPPIPKRFARSVPRDLQEAKPSPCC